MKKSSFFTFIFAFMPGAGQMYLGLMKKGVSIMAAFCVSIMVIAFLRIEAFAFVLPVIWFYSFFDAINYNGLPFEQKVLVKDAFLFDFDTLSDKYSKSTSGKKNVILGAICLIFGAFIIFERIVEPMLWRIRDISPILDSIVRNIPTLFIALAVIMLGLKLIKTKGTEIEDMREGYKEFGENKNDRE